MHLLHTLFGSLYGCYMYAGGVAVGWFLRGACK